MQGADGIPRPLPDLLIELMAPASVRWDSRYESHLLDLLQREGEASVWAVADGLSTTQQNASRHLGVLAQAGLVTRRQHGRVAWCRLAHDDVFALIETTAAELLDELRNVDRPEVYRQP
jgi:DNA-binding transcriptional ArsR family regulator